MAGFLGFGNFTKEGKGVNKGEPRKKGFSLYMELLTRKFGSYVKLNFMYLLTCIPSLLIINFVAYFFISGYVMSAPGATWDAELASGVVLLSFIISFFVTMLFSLSPFSSGYYYVLRNYSEESHAWLLSDFIKHFKNNKKQSLITYLIDVLVAVFFIFSTSIYLRIVLTSKAMWVPFVLFLIVALTYANTATYRWTMIVTLELKLKDIFKNSFLLIMGELLTTLKYILATAIYGVVFYLIFMNFSILGFLFFLLIGFSGLGLIQQINFFPVFKKYFLEGKTVDQIIEETTYKTVQDNEETSTEE